MAWKMGERDYRVSVFDQKPAIGGAICSGLLSDRILKFIPLSAGLVQNEIDFALIHFPKKTIKIEFSGKFLVIDHSELDKLVATLAQKAGAEIFLNSGVKELPRGFDRIIGCDGPNSSVRRLLKLPDPSMRLGIQGFVREENSLNYVETWPCKNGFIWKIPRGQKTEYGILAPVNIAKTLLNDFLAKNNIILSGLGSKLIPQGLIFPSNQNVTLCGDSAGLTKPWSGGGVIWGLTAAEMLIKNFPDFIAYKKEVKKYFSRKIFLAKAATKLGYFLGFNAPWMLPQNIRIESDFLVK